MPSLIQMKAVVDCSNAAIRARVVAYVERLRGRQRFEIVRYRPRRSDRQNAYYWPCIVEPFAQWLSEHWGESFTADDAHEILKGRFLVREYVDPATGELFTRVGSTADLTTLEFSQYVERARQLLVEYCQIAVPPPSLR